MTSKVGLTLSNTALLLHFIEAVKCSETENFGMLLGSDLMYGYHTEKSQVVRN